MTLEAIKHYQEVRRRLWGEPPRPVRLQPKPSFEAELACTRDAVVAANRQNDILTRDLQSAKAALALAMAQIEALRTKNKLHQQRAQAAALRAAEKIEASLNQPGGMKAKERAKYTFSRILFAVSSHLGIRTILILSPSKETSVVRARHIACYLGVEGARMSLSDVGRCIGRDHTSVLHAVIKIKDQLSAGDAMLHADIDAIRAINHPPTSTRETTNVST